jgi:hypothetical protein
MLHYTTLKHYTTLAHLGILWIIVRLGQHCELIEAVIQEVAVVVPRHRSLPGGKQFLHVGVALKRRVVGGNSVRTDAGGGEGSFYTWKHGHNTTSPTKGNTTQHSNTLWG